MLEKTAVLQTCSQYIMLVKTRFALQACSWYIPLVNTELYRAGSQYILLVEKTRDA